MMSPRASKSEEGPGLDKAVLIATGIVQPIAEALRQLTGVTILLDKAEAARAQASDFAAGLQGLYWAVPVELTGVHNGATCVLVSQTLVLAPGSSVSEEDAALDFASTIDDQLARAGDKLKSAWGGPVSLDRLGLRRTSADSAPQVLSEALGPGGLVAVRFPASGRPPAKRAKGGRDGDTGEVLVVLGGRLAVDVAGWPAGTRAGPGSADTQPLEAASASSGRPPRAGKAQSLPAGGEVPTDQAAAETAKALASDLIMRARSLTVRAAADVGARSMTLGELARLGPGSVIDLAKKVTEPLELRVQGHLVASGDAVTLPRGFGFRVRYLGVR